MDEKAMLGEKYQAQVTDGEHALLASVELRHAGWRASLTVVGRKDKELLLGAQRFHHDTKELAMQVIEDRLNSSRTSVSKTLRLSWAKVMPGT